MADEEKSADPMDRFIAKSGDFQVKDANGKILTKEDFAERKRKKESDAAVPS